MNTSTPISLGLVFSIAGPIFAILLGLNGYFLKQLVEKINCIPQVLAALSKLQENLQGVVIKQAEHALDIRELRRLEGRIAYIEGAIRVLKAEMDQAVSSASSEGGPNH